MSGLSRIAAKLYGQMGLLGILPIDREAYRVIQDVVKHGLSYLSTQSLVELHQTTRALERSGRDGAFLEAGCALGGSALVIAASKNRLRPFHIYDVFGMIPPPSERDGTDAHQRYALIASGDSSGIRGDTYYGYQDNLLGKVERTFADFGYPVQENNIHLVQGYFEDTLVVDEPVLMAHIDSDWYDSVLTCLRRIEPRLVSGGALIIDDYHTWSGCRAAVDEYFASREGQFRFVEKSRLQIFRR